MTATKRDGEFVADFTPKGRRLREPKMMGIPTAVVHISGTAAQRRISRAGDPEADVVPGTRERKRAVIDPC
jgi:hypothetical protein